jgi:hypothetical protein
LFEEGSGRCLITVLRKHEINSIAEFINSAILVNPFTLNFDIGFIYSPGPSNSALKLFSGCSGMGAKIGERANSIVNNALKCGF